MCKQKVSINKFFYRHRFSLDVNTMLTKEAAMELKQIGPRIRVQTAEDLTALAKERRTSVSVLVDLACQVYIQQQRGEQNEQITRTKDNRRD